MSYSIGLLKKYLLFSVFEMFVFQKNIVHLDIILRSTLLLCCFTHVRIYMKLITLNSNNITMFCTRFDVKFT